MTAGQGWGRAFLAQCEIDPDGEADVRAAYESCRESHARWLTKREGDMDGETYYMLVGAIEDLYGWKSGPWPLDWPAPYLALISEPFRDLIPRTPRTEAT